MTKVLQQLLDAKEPLFSRAVEQLEKASGLGGYDIKLVGEIAQKVREKIIALGLDPNDTTGRELYAALLVKVEEDNQRLAHSLGVNSPDSVVELAPRIITAVQQLNGRRQVWVIKRPVLKRLLKTLPPKHVMKQLGYRSLDSMLKHENIDELYVAIRLLEDEAWLTRHNALYKKLSSRDFESRRPSFLTLDYERYVTAAEAWCRERAHHVVHSKETGVVAVAPSGSISEKGYALTTFLYTVHYLNEIRAYATFFKLKQVHPDFGKIVAHVLHADDVHAEVAEQHVHWKVVQRHVGSSDTANHPEFFEPHVQPEDILWQADEVLLSKLDKRLQFWVGLEYVGVVLDDRPLVFNLIDMSLNYAKRMPYEERTTWHFRDCLWNELLMRYMGSARVRDVILRQLDTTSFVPKV